MPDRQRKAQDPQTIDLKSISELRELIEMIPEGTIYSLDLGEVSLVDGEETE